MTLLERRPFGAFGGRHAKDIRNYHELSCLRAAATLKISARGISFDVQTDDPGSLRSGKRDCTLPLLRAAAVEP
jgi:hypothetical protein